MDYVFDGIPEFGTSVDIYEATNNGKLNLTSLNSITLTKDSLPQYAANVPALKHIRLGDNIEALLYIDPKDNNKPICVLSVETKGNGEKWIQALEVFKGYRRRGLGKQLVEYACNHLGAKFLSVRKTNEPAIKLYTLHGFKTYSSIGDMFFMKKE